MKLCECVGGGSLRLDTIFNNVVRGWREKVGGETVTDEGRQKVDLQTMLPFLHECDTLVCECDALSHECDTLVCECDSSLRECNNFWNYNIETFLNPEPF